MQNLINNLPDGTLVYFSSKFQYRRWGDWKHAITKPLHYGIQWGTGSKYHHVGIICGGMMFEAMAKTGVRAISLQAKLDELDDCVEVIICKPSTPLTTEQSVALQSDLYRQIGKKYPTFEALGSILTKILFWQDEVKTKRMFCSKLVMYAYMNLYPKILAEIIPRKYNPEESYKTLRRTSLILPAEILSEAYSR